MFAHGFGEGSDNETNLARARSAGQWRIGGMPESQIPRNYQLRIEQYEAALSKVRSKELECMLPEQELKGAYPPGDEYAFYKDLKSIVATARAAVLIVDGYLDTSILTSTWTLFNGEWASASSQISHLVTCGRKVLGDRSVDQGRRQDKAHLHDGI